MATTTGAEPILQKFSNHLGEIGNGVRDSFNPNKVEDSDVKIVCEGGTIHLQRVILALASPLFKSIFAEMETPLDMYTIILPDVPYADMLLLVRSMYGGKMGVPREQVDRVDDLMQLFGLFDKFVCRKVHGEGAPSVKDVRPHGGSKSRSGRQDLASSQLDDDDRNAAGSSSHKLNDVPIGTSVFNSSFLDAIDVMDKLSTVPISSSAKTPTPVNAVEVDDQQRDDLASPQLNDDDRNSATAGGVNDAFIDDSFGGYAMDYNSSPMETSNGDDPLFIVHEEASSASSSETPTPPHASAAEEEQEDVAVANREHVAHQEPHHDQDEHVDLDVAAVGQEIDRGMELDEQSHSEANTLDLNEDRHQVGSAAGQEGRPISRRSTRSAATPQNIAGKIFLKSRVKIGSVSSTGKGRLTRSTGGGRIATANLKKNKKKNNVSFPCRFFEECERKFNRKGNMNRHCLIHTGERPFICEFCEASFRQQPHLKKHIFSKHRNEELQPPKIKGKRPIEGSSSGVGGPSTLSQL